MVNYTSYFDKLPKIKYDINRSLVNPKYESVTNIFFRIRYIKDVINNTSSYYTLEVTAGDTIEILAEKIYGDAGAGWMIILANQIIDPQWDWPLNYDEFNKFIIGKYGSIENAQITNHHYEMVVEKTVQPDNITTVKRYTVGGNKLTDNNLDVPHNYYFPYQPNPTDPGSLAFTQSVNTYEVAGKTVTEVIKGEAITNYQYEEALNDQRRLIKVVKKEYYARILNEFDNLTDYTEPYRRRVR